MFEGVGKHSAGKMSDEDLHELECVACPSAGSCGGQFTANTMACVSEAMGLALPGSAGTPAPYRVARRLCRGVGPGGDEPAAPKRLRPRDIVTRKALENAATIVAASGGSTNAALHLPAIAHEAGIDFDMHAVGEIFKRTPYIGDFKPGGRYVMKDLYDVGGVPVLMKALLDGGYLHGDCITVTGKTIAENLQDVKCPTNQDVVRPTSNALSPTGGVVVLKGNLAPQGAIVKVAGMKGMQLKFRGPARCFDREEDCFAAVEKRQYKEGDVLVIRYEGPRGGPGMREMLSTTAALYGQGMRRQGGADHRRALLRRHARLLHRPCRAGGGGRRPDRPVERRRHDRRSTRCRHAQRRIERRRTGGAAQGVEAAPARLSVRRLVALCADVGDAEKGAVTHPGARAETFCYADI